MTPPPQRDRRDGDKKLVDLHVNIPTLAVIILQTFAAASAMTTLFNENTAQTKELNQITTRLYQVERAIGGSQVLESRMITIENELRFLRGNLDRINDKRGR